MLGKAFSGLSLVLLLTTPGFAQETSNIPGAFANIGVGAGPMGMAGATVVLGRDIYSMVRNPASLTSVRAPQAAFSMTKQFSLIPYNLLLYGQSIGRFSVGAGFLTAGDDALRENTVYLAAARRLRRMISLGLTFKFRQASFGNNGSGAWVHDGGNRQVRGDATGYSFDLGIRGILTKDAGFALVLQDLFGALDYDAANEVGTARGGEENTTTTLLLGFGYAVHKNLILEVNARKALHHDLHDRLTLGLEHTLFALLTLRSGVSQNIDSDESNRHYSLGLGISHKLLLLRFATDLAYVINDIDDFFHVGIRLGWN